MQKLTDAKLLVVDDSPEVLAMVCGLLRDAGYARVSGAETCEQARRAFAKAQPDFLILDINLPDGDGFALLRELRAAADVPALFLSARDADSDRLFGLGLGADDYLTKPFLPQELLLRMQLILRRAYKAELAQGDTVRLGDAVADLAAASARTPQGEAALTAKEVALLRKLSENRGRIVTFDALCEAAWGDGYYGYENALMVHMRHLREKLEENPSQPQWILTARGLGYRLAGEESVK